MAITDTLRDKAVEIVKTSPQGIRLTDLKKKLQDLFPDTNYNALLMKKGYSKAAYFAKKEWTLNYLYIPTICLRNGKFQKNGYGGLLINLIGKI